MILYEFTISAEPTDSFAKIDRLAAEIMEREIAEQELQNYQCTTTLTKIETNADSSICYYFIIEGT